jgi:hypothetical protein
MAIFGPNRDWSYTHPQIGFYVTRYQVLNWRELVETWWSYGANGFAPLFIIFHVQHVPGFLINVKEYFANNFVSDFCTGHAGATPESNPRFSPSTPLLCHSRCSPTPALHGACSTYITYVWPVTLLCDDVQERTPIPMWRTNEQVQYMNRTEIISVGKRCV